MNLITTQSLFTSASTSRSWKSYATSTGVHAVLIILLLAITFPVVNEVEKPAARTTLIAPVLPAKITPYRVKVKHPSIQVKPLARIVPPKPAPQIVTNPPEMKQETPQVKPQLLAELPKQPSPMSSSRPAPAAKPTVRFDSPVAVNTPVAKPAQVHTGLFGGTELAKGQTVANQVKVGGFGDPHGINPKANTQASSMTMAKLGGFDLPTGAGNEGGGGTSTSGSVRQSGFGSVGAGSGATGSRGGQQGNVKTGGFGNSSSDMGAGTGRLGGSVKTGNFGDSASNPLPAGEIQRARLTPLATPVEITFKPRPAYTPEARDLRLEGQVKLEVVFLASGAVRVLRVVQGLGHGLDQAAQQAAAQVRFRPATRDGVAVDTNATIYISFELT